MRSVADAEIEGTRDGLSGHPLVVSAARLSQLDERIRLRTRVPARPEWLGIATAADPASVRERLRTLGGDRRGMHGVAAAQLAASVACTVVRPVMAMLFLERRVPEPSPELYFVEASPTGRFEQLAILPGTVTTLATDAAAGHPATRTVRDTGELLDAAADVVVRILSPVLTTIRAEGRYGLRQLWGAVLDMIGATSLLTARVAGLDQHGVWDQARLLGVMVRERVEQPGAGTPRPFSVAFSGGEALYTVKGTCCLKYREHGLRASDAHGESECAYCKTCPFLRDESRAARCGDQMEHEAGGRLR